MISEVIKISDPVQRESKKQIYEELAKKLKCLTDFKRIYKATLKQYIYEQRTKGSLQTSFSNIDVIFNCGNWVAEDTGIYTTVYKNDNPYKLYACSHPIYIDKQFVSYEDKTVSVKLMYKLEEYWQSVTVPKSIIANRNKIVALSDYGIEVTSENAKNLVMYLSDLSSLNTIEKLQGTEKLGWKNNDFVPYSDNFTYTGESKFRDLFESVAYKGMYVIWLQYTKKIIENSKVARLVFATSCSAPFVKKLGLLPFIVHLWGGTGSGKTVALMMGASVWGNPEIGKLVRTLNSTLVGFERTADMLNNIPLFCDELQLIKHQSQYKNGYDSLIMNLCQGTGRSRGNTTGGNDKLTEWSTTFIFTGEEPITSDSLGGGSKNRVIEIEATDKIIENGHETSNFYRRNYGHLGIMIIEYYKEHQEDFKLTYEQKYIELLPKTSEKQAMAYALILAVDEIVSKHYFDIQPMQLDDDLFSFKSKDEISTVKRSYDTIISIISKNRIRFNSDLDINRGEVWGYIKDDYCYFDKRTLEAQLRENNFSFDAVKKGWAKDGYIELNSQGRYVHNRNENGMSAMYIKLLLPQQEDITVEEKDMFEQQNL